MASKRVTEQEYRFRIAETIKRIRKGWSRGKCEHWLMDTYKIKETAAYNTVRDAYNKLSEKSEAIIHNAKFIQVERIEDLLTEALESEDRKTAVKALDMLNKIYNLYSTKAEIQLNGKELKFSFGGDTEETEESDEV